jgi:hypothetical protein
MNYIQDPIVKKIIDNLIAEQIVESESNFPNGDHWNDLEFKITNLVKYGQEQDPEPIYSKEGYVDGYRLNSGEEFYYSGMSIYDYAD